MLITFYNTEKEEYKNQQAFEFISENTTKNKAFSRFQLHTRISMDSRERERLDMIKKGIKRGQQFVEIKSVVHINTKNINEI